MSPMGFLTEHRVSGRCWSAPVQSPPGPRRSSGRWRLEKNEIRWPARRLGDNHGKSYGMQGIHDDLLGFNEDLLRFYDDLMGIHDDLMGFHDDLMVI